MHLYGPAPVAQKQRRETGEPDIPKIAPIIEFKASYFHLKQEQLCAVT